MPAPKPSFLGPLRPNTFRPPRGQKKVYLPSFTLTLLRTPHSPPHFATFITPLYLNKLDLKDYLWHAYGLQALRIRSYVQQSKIMQDKPTAMMPRPHRWFRPRSKKRMTVELPPDQPFRFPDAPTDLSPWDKDRYEKMEKARDEAKEQHYQGQRIAPKQEERDKLRSQARELLEGKRVWKAGWMDYGGVRPEQARV
ncbi:MAG: hypothetical protein LQ351_002557 [Letrouitia transgressa]|nr:MAG: hypothetical protein LQ351_002557 [Letrouitia transgressa]